MLTNVKSSIQIIVFIITPLISFSQSDSISGKRHSITAYIGLSLPLDQYKKSYTEEAFPASVGYNLKLEGAYQIKNKLHASVSLGYFSNSLNKDDYGPIYLSDQRTLRYLISNEKYKNFYILLGPSYEISGDKFVVDFKIRTGMLISLEPDLTKEYTTYYNSSGDQIDPVRQKPFIYSETTETLETKGASNAALAFSFASGYSYSISEKMGVKLDLELIFGNPGRRVSVLNMNLGLKYFID